MPFEVLPHCSQCKLAMFQFGFSTLSQSFALIEIVFRCHCLISKCHLAFLSLPLTWSSFNLSFVKIHFERPNVVLTHPIAQLSDLTWNLFLIEVPLQGLFGVFTLTKWWTIAFHQVYSLVIWLFALMTKVSFQNPSQPTLLYFLKDWIVCLTLLKFVLIDVPDLLKLELNLFL